MEESDVKARAPDLTWFCYMSVDTAVIVSLLLF